MWNRTMLRVAVAGIATAALIAAAGGAIERQRFGATDETAVARVEAELHRHFDNSAAMLATLAARVLAARASIAAAQRDTAEARGLFDLLDGLVPADQTGRTGITVYDSSLRPIAWTGRVSEVPRELLEGAPALRVRPGAFGPVLVHVEPIGVPERAAGSRAGAVVVEQLVGEPRALPAAAPTDTFVVATSLAPVTLRPVVGAVQHRSPYEFVIRTTAGGSLAEAEVLASDLVAARARWRQGTRAAALAVVAVTLLVVAGLLVEPRRLAHTGRRVGMATAGMLLALGGARVVLWLAMSPAARRREPIDSPGLLLTALLLAAGVWVAVDLVERRRVARPRIRLLDATPAALVSVAAAFAAAGAVAATLLWAYQRFLLTVVSRTTVDLLHLSSETPSVPVLIVAFGLLVLHAGVVWTAALVLRIVAVGWRTPRTMALRGWVALWWALGAGGIMWLARTLPDPPPLVPLAVAVAASGACAAALGRAGHRARRASQTARLGALYLALLVPSAAMYPALHAFAVDAKERLIEREFGPQAKSQREDLLTRQLPEALEQIDAMTTLADFVAGSGEVGAPTTDRAFLVWSRTELARYRLTSAVELYGQDGRLVSRFALDLPEYATSDYWPSGCDWDTFEEPSRFGSTERHVLRASRGICNGRRRVGAIAVRAMLDYQALPFIASERPYLRPGQVTGENGSGAGDAHDVEFVMYGWSRAPIHNSGARVWPLPDEVFDRMAASRGPFWAHVDRDGETFRVYYLNDRAGIYALGYPAITSFAHVVNLAEIAALTGVLYVLFVGGATLFGALFVRAPASGRALLREVRSSFYRKLWILFVLAAVVPVIVLAVATRAYFATEWRTGIEEEAAKNAAVAQRLVEDYATLQRQGAGTLELVDDQVIVLVKRAVGQDVDLYAGARLQATSQRDLYAQEMLPTRTPGDVYRAIALDRLPVFVGEEDVGGTRFLIAAAPVRAGGTEGIVSVPQALRNEEIERQIDELDRRVVFASVLFVLLGAALGYWMAERIADPVKRLTRATRRIARGDLDARIAATSSDELRRLVEDFNLMAADLKRQRSELERTQRLEAWADMARQVAHDIKNPLTPIQLSAEHARRVNNDRGRPLSPVLDDCVGAILNQVQLLRQISAEFSSFASSPTPRPEPTDLGELIEEVVEPYRTGLAGRIAIDVRAAPGLPTVTIDRTLFGRALTNVIENALHAMPGAGTLSIVSSQQSADHAAPAVVVDVRDSGVGMDPESLGRLFEPYFSTKATGTGLGLTIARRNIELNGGTIAVASARGVGTTVTIRLPLASEAGG